MTLDDIVADFDYLDDWEDRYRYVIELGKKLEPLPDEQRTDANKVRGCVSQVWLSTSVSDDTEPSVLRFVGDSDALIVRGLIAILFAMFSNKSAQDILAVDAKGMFASLGLSDHLTPQRSNGFFSMVERIRRDAEAALGHATSAS